jgi:molybdenum cofactor biosynthesis protein B
MPTFPFLIEPKPIMIPLDFFSESPAMFKSERDDTKPFVPLSIAVIAVSDTRTLETDTGGALLKSLLEADGHTCAERVVVRDDIQQIRAAVQRFVADRQVDVILTTGGTGFSGRDVTPEAVEPLFDKRMEGFSVLFHQYSSTTIGTSSLQSRATAGLIGTTFLFSLPGSRGACRDAWEGILSQQLDFRHKPCNFVELMPRLDEHLKK